MSYKLGVSKNLDSLKYNKIKIGPISLATQHTTGVVTGIAHNITSSKQRLSAPIRLFPKLLVVSTDYLKDVYGFVASVSEIGYLQFPLHVE